MPRVLLIDDEPRVSRALTYALAGRDIQLQAATDAGEVDAVMTREVPDVVLLDVGLVGQDGLEVCRRLRANPRFRDVPVLLLSGQTDAATKRAGFEAGADDFIAKPFVPEELLARIDAHIRRRQQA
jgi:DNA-binding response OmpR family regulator